MTHEIPHEITSINNTRFLLNLRVEHCTVDFLASKLQNKFEWWLANGIVIVGSLKWFYSLNIQAEPGKFSRKLHALEVSVQVSRIFSRSRASSMS